MFIPMWMLVAAALGVAVLIGLLLIRGNDVRRDDMMGPPRSGFGAGAPRAASGAPATQSREALAQRVAGDPEVRAALLAGRKIEAIKLVRERTGLDLKAAKDAVEALDQAR